MVFVTSNSGKLVYPPVGRCIYCGDTETLTLEHIIPYALNGTFELPAASCKVCARIINQEVEGVILGKMLGSLRIKMGLRTRNPKKRREIKTTPVIRGKSVGDKFVRTHTEETPWQELPLSIFGLVLGAPGIITGEPPSEKLTLKWWVYSDPKALDRFVPDDGSGFEVAGFHPGLFCRMLAKIAHSFAAAELGLDTFRPLLLDLILGRVNTPGYWIGGDQPIPPPDHNGLHCLKYGTGLIRGVKYCVVTVRLFAPYGAPEYHIITGELLSQQ